MVESLILKDKPGATNKAECDENYSVCDGIFYCYLAIIIRLALYGCIYSILTYIVYLLPVRNHRLQHYCALCKKKGIPQVNHGYHTSNDLFGINKSEVNKGLGGIVGSW